MKSEIVQLRLYNQRLVGEKFRTAAEVVRWMGAVQGQEYPFAKWALGLRVEGATEAVIEQAFNDGEILRTHVLRPTWHFVTPADIRWLLELTAPRVHAAMAAGYRNMELDAPLARRTHAAMRKLLRDGNALTRKELREGLERSGIPVKTTPRMAFMTGWAELDRVICSGPRRNNEMTYMLLDERAPETKPLTRDEALAELALRYFASHGPATLHDFAWWSGLTVTDGKAGVAMAGSMLVGESIDGKMYWFSSNLPKMSKVSAAHFLPVLDEFVVAYRDPSLIFDPSLERQAKNRNFVSSLEIDGRIVGEWKPMPENRPDVLQIELYQKLTGAQERALAAAAKRYGKFFGRQVSLRERQVS